MSDKLRSVTEQSFKVDVLDAGRPVPIDFYADWCAPCRMITPIIEQLADEFAGRVEFRKADLDQVPRVAARFGVRSLPTLMLFKDGKPQESLVGAATKPAVSQLLDRHT
ncbi:MAG: thioredoxin [Gammaproteobacteria bacterium]|nr:MAG: thioredoxin [Gammaproteobacteria bacterium]